MYDSALKKKREVKVLQCPAQYHLHDLAVRLPLHSLFLRRCSNLDRGSEVYRRTQLEKIILVSLGVVATKLHFFFFFLEVTSSLSELSKLHHKPRIQFQRRRPAATQFAARMSMPLEVFSIVLEEAFRRLSSLTLTFVCTLRWLLELVG